MFRNTAALEKNKKSIRQYWLSKDIFLEVADAILEGLQKQAAVAQDLATRLRVNSPIFIHLYLHLN